MPRLKLVLNLNFKGAHLLKSLASMSKPQILHGVPYTVNELSNAYAYQPNALASFHFGTAVTLNQDPKAPKGIQLDPDWRTKAQPFLDAYRESLKLKTEQKLATRTTTL
jgi:hypothetical protein